MENNKQLTNQSAINQLVAKIDNFIEMVFTCILYEIRMINEYKHMIRAGRTAKIKDITDEIQQDIDLLLNTSDQFSNLPMFLRIEIEKVVVKNKQLILEVDKLERLEKDHEAK